MNPAATVRRIRQGARDNVNHQINKRSNAARHTDKVVRLRSWKDQSARNRTKRITTPARPMTNPAGHKRSPGLGSVPNYSLETVTKPSRVYNLDFEMGADGGRQTAEIVQKHVAQGDAGSPAGLAAGRNQETTTVKAGVRR